MNREVIQMLKGQLRADQGVMVSHCEEYGWVRVAHVDPSMPCFPALIVTNKAIGFNKEVISRLLWIAQLVSLQRCPNRENDFITNTHKGRATDVSS